MLCIIVSVADLNPATVRYFTAPETLSAAGFFDTCAVVLGLDPKRVTVRPDEYYNPPAFLESMNGMDPENAVISALFHAGDIFRLRLSAPGVSDFLSLRVEIADIQKDKQIVSESIPTVTMAVGLDLPPNVFRTDEICYRFHADTRRIRTGYGSVQGTGNELQFDFRRTDNKLRQLFAPETALPEVKTELGRPLLVLLESLTVQEIKLISVRIGSYWYGSMNKVSFIMKLREYMTDTWLRELLERLPLEELQVLRSCALGQTEIRDTLSKQQTLQSSGLLVSTRDHGIYYASELLNVLGRLIGTEGERKLVANSACRTALRACAVYYTVFSEEMYLRVLKVLLPECSRNMAQNILGLELTFDSRDDWYNLNRNQTSGQKIYNAQMVKAAETKKISIMNLHSEQSTYLPTKEEIMYAASHGMTAMEEELCSAVRKKIPEIFQDEWSIRMMLGMTRTGASPEKIVEELDSYVGFRVYIHAFTDKLQPVLKERFLDLPLAPLGGFTRRNVPKEVLRYAQSVKKNNRANKSVEL